MDGPNALAAMGLVSKALAGRADGKAVSAEVKAQLS
jgi:uncharacterized protein YqeY